jgi:hypothetical protein
VADPVIGIKCVYLPDVNYGQLQKFVDEIYKGETSITIGTI